MVDFDRFVEGHITTIETNDQAKSVCIEITDRYGKKARLVASGVREVVAIEMRLQNIIDRISVWNSASKDSLYRESLHLLICGTLSVRSDDLNSPIIDTVVDSIKRGELIFLEIEPVYGALILLTGKEVSIS